MDFAIWRKYPQAVLPDLCVGQGLIPFVGLVADAVGRVGDQCIYALVRQMSKAVAAFGVEGKRRVHGNGKLRNTAKIVSFLYKDKLFLWFI